MKKKSKLDKHEKKIHSISEKLGVSFKGYNKEHVFTFNEKTFYFMAAIYVRDFIVVGNKLIFKVLNSGVYEFAFEINFEENINVIGNEHRDLIKFLGYEYA